MQIRFWGTRGSIAKPGQSTVRYGGNTSCVELRTDSGTLVVLDCGTGAHELGRRLVSQHNAATRGHILISHTHWDHIQGIPFFEPFFQPGGEWDIYGPKGLLQSIRETLAGQMEHNYFPISVEKFGATIRYHDLVEGSFNIDDLQVVTQYLNHPALTLGYKLQADGATVVYCCDHEPNVVAAASGTAEITGHDSRHVEFLSRADLVVHDAQYTAQEYPAKIGWGHSTVEYVVRVCQAAAVKRVALTHHDPLRDDDAVDRIVEKLRQQAAGKEPPLDIVGAAEGLVLHVAATGNGALATSAEQFAAKTSVDAATLRRPVLLHIADSGVRRLLVEAIRLEGLPEPVEFLSGTTPDAIAADRYSLALIQHDPPTVEGLRIAQRIQTGQSNAALRVPVVLVTADPEQQASHDGTLTDWLVAPFSLSYARTKLRFWTLRLACRWVRARLPVNETRRIDELHRLAVLDTPAEERFDRITRITAATLNVPIALISLVDQDRQWFKSCVGIDASETPREVAFCAHAVLQRADVIVPDTLLDDRFADNPLVVDGPRIRFYAGAPLQLGNGDCLGTLCVADTRPRLLSASEMTMLHDLRDMALEQLTRSRAGAA